MPPPDGSSIRHDWTRGQVLSLFNQPFNDLLFDAQVMHRQHFDPNQVQLSTLLSIKTGACPEDCKYCPQSARYDTGLGKEKLLQIEQVIEAAKVAKASGSSRFCMGAAWRSPHDRDIPAVAEMIREVKSLGLETCMTLGMLSEDQSDKLADAGLDYYNHNLDTGPDEYADIIKTRDYQDRLDTLDNVREAGLKTCCGGIVGMGESRQQRAGLLQTLADGIKLFFKEDLIPDRSDRFVFKLAPYLAFVPAFLVWSVIPLGGDFSNGKMHGKGTLINQQGTEKFGEFKEGRVTKWIGASKT